MTFELISDFEDSIDLAKEEFFNSFNEILISINNVAEESRVQEQLNVTHSKAIKFFTLFERSIDEYGLDNFKLNEDIKIRKIEDSINIANTIANYWKLLNIKIPQIKKYNLITPPVPQKAYGSLQRFLKTYSPNEISELRKKFKEAKIPIDGFDSKDKHQSMSNNPNSTQNSGNGSTQNLILEMIKNHKEIFISLIGIGLFLILYFQDSIRQYISGSEGEEKKEQVSGIERKVTLIGHLVNEKTRKSLDGVTVYLENQSLLRDSKISNGRFILEGVLLPKNNIITIMIEDRHGKIAKTRSINLANKAKYPNNNDVIDLRTKYINY